MAAETWNVDSGPLNRPFNPSSLRLSQAYLKKKNIWIASTIAFADFFEYISKAGHHDLMSVNATIRVFVLEGFYYSNFSLSLAAELQPMA